MPKFTLADIHIRDPFVLPVASEGRYYLYGTMGQYTWQDHAVGVDAWESRDLQTWEGPIPVFRPPADFWSDRNFWAPEVYAWQGRYYMFISFKAQGVCRGTQILAADSARGPFLPISAGPVTPSDWECLDGTFYVAPDGRPWMIFCHEWVQVGDGEICGLPLTTDLTAAAGEPLKLFNASEAPWVKLLESKGRRGYVTDGPFIHRTDGGALLLLWSSHSQSGYTVGVARSESSQIEGPWLQQAEPLYSDDGGHCMTFKDFEGGLWLTYHHPDGFPNERPVFKPLLEGERLALK